jgi:predicted PurR-regulated permease PerM
VVERLNPKRISDETLNRILKFLAIALLALATLFMMVQFRDLWLWIADAFKAVIVPVTAGYLIALLVYPLIRYLEKKGIGPRFLSLIIVFLLAFGIVLASFFFLVPLIAREITNFFNNDFNTILDYFTIGLRDDFILGTELYDSIMTYINDSNLIGNFLNNLLPSAITYLTSSLLPAVTIIFILPIILIYYLKDYETIGEQLRGTIPAKHEKNVAELGSRLNNTVGAYLRGQLLLMVAIGAVATVIYKAIGLKYYFVFGLIVGITNIIPYFGSVIAVIPPMLYAAVSVQSGALGPGPLIVIGVNIGLQFVEGNIFQPIIMSHQLKMHPLVIIMSIFFFGSLFGVWGVIFASPIAASIRVIFQFMKEKRLEKEAREKLRVSGSG